MVAAVVAKEATQPPLGGPEEHLTTPATPLLLLSDTNIFSLANLSFTPSA